MHEAHPSATVFGLISGMMRTQTIAAFAELGVADAIATGTTSVDGLARQVGANADALRRMLRLLEADGLVRQSPPDTWALTETGELLREGVEGSLRHLAMLFGAELYDAWSGAAGSFRSGEAAFDEHYGMPFFDWLQRHPELARRFDRAMSGTAPLRALPMLDRDWSGVSTVVDVGGGNGALLEALLPHLPGVQGISFDLAQVSERAATSLASSPVADRIRVEAGDFFDGPPAGGDVYLLSQVLHDWSDLDCIRILEGCRTVARDEARLLVLEQVLPEGPEPSAVKFTDLNMLILLGGRERSLAEFDSLLARGGWQLVDHREGPRWSMLEAAPAQR